VDPTVFELIQIGLWMNYEMDRDQRFIPARWSDQIGFILKHMKVRLQVVESLPMGSGMAMSSSSRLQLAAITQINNRPGGVANLGNGAYNITRVTSVDDRERDIAGTQDDTGTLTH
jgi:pantoate kinase